MATVFKVPVPTETAETRAVIKWWAYACHSFGQPARCLIHVPNEGKRSKAMGARLKAEGMRTGTPDLFMAAQSHGKPGLWIEMKRTKGGTASDDQRAMQALLSAQGYAVRECRGAAEAIAAIKGYFAGEI